MKLEEIGFYTLSDARAKRASASSPLERCELILTDRCNLRCGYCRGLRPELQGDMPVRQAFSTVDMWLSQGLKNVRFSGGEPTLWLALPDLVSYCKEYGVDRIAVSTNGTASPNLYNELVAAGVNDFSVSLDGACCSAGDLASGVPGCWKKATDAIRMLSASTYVTVGVVLTETNSEEVLRIIEFASNLGVADIRVIPAAQYQKTLSGISSVAASLLRKHPILRYRVDAARAGQPVRGLNGSRCRRCRLVLDDMAVAGQWHFPCIIYLREGGNPIGSVGPCMRKERRQWSESHDVRTDPICRSNCLDVCVAYNKKASSHSGDQTDAN